MADLSTNCAGIRSPNPFWLASAPPANSGEQVLRAFEYGWGGAVWKTLGQDPPVINTTSRYGAIDIGGQKRSSQRVLRPCAPTCASLRSLKSSLD